MRAKEHASKNQSAKTGSFAVLSNLPRGQGTSAPAPRRLALTLLAILCLLAAFATGASAALTHHFQAAIGAGELESTPVALAVDQSSGDLYVASANSEGAEGVLRRYDPSGNPAPFPSTGTNSHGSGCFAEESTGLAVDNSGGANAGHFYSFSPPACGLPPVVQAFNASGEPADFSGSVSYLSANTITGSPSGGFGPDRCGLAVDSNGDIYVGEYTVTGVGEFIGTVYVYSSSGEYITQTSSAQACNLAVDGQGNLYANAFFDEVSELTPSSFPVTASTTYSAPTVVDPTASHGVALDPATDDLYVNNGSFLSQYDSAAHSNTLLARFGSAQLDGRSRAIAVNRAAGPGQGDVYAGAGNQVDVFGPSLIIPDATTGEAVEVTNAAAKLEATVGAAGGPAATCKFEYSTDESFSESAPCVPAGPFTGSSTQPVSAQLSGLSPSTLYNYRLVAENENGSNPGEPRTFRTTGPPTVIGSSLSALSGIAATVEAQLNPSGFDTHYKVIYGTEADVYPSESGETDIGSSSQAQASGTQLTGLNPSTTYHYRIVATNHCNSAEPAETCTVESSEDQEFTTEPPALIEAEQAGDVTRTCATLNARVNPDGSETSVFFEYVDLHDFETGGFSNPATKVTSPAVPIGSANEVQLASTEVCGLSHEPTLGVKYRFRAVATNPAAPLGGVQGEAEAFTTLPTVLFAGLSASNVTAEGATLNAKLNPLGEDTRFHFQYLTEAQFQEEGGFSGPAVRETPEADLGSGSVTEIARQEVSGLSPETAYVFRLLAHNPSGSFESPPRAFTTVAPFSACPNAQLRAEDNSTALPDCRAYELVTPPLKNGQIPFAAASSAAGSSLTFTSLGAFGEAGDSSGPSGPSYLATRNASGWSSQPIESSATQFASAFSEGSLSDFSRDLSRTLVQRVPKAAKAVDSRFYLRSPAGAFDEVGPTIPPARAESWTQAEGEKSVEPGIEYRGASPDLSHIVFGSGSQEVTGGRGGSHPGFLWPGDSTVKFYSLYEYSGTANAEPSLVGVAPGPGEAKHLPKEDPTLVSQCGTNLGAPSIAAAHQNSLDAYNAISAGGSKIFFTAEEGGCGGQGPLVNELYARIDASRTVAISEPSPADCAACDTEPGAQAPAVFQGASEDGSRVFFLSQQQLFSGTKGEAGVNLYEYDFNAPAQEKVSFLASRMASSSSFEGPAGVLRVAENGSRVYFASTAVLTGAEENAFGAKAQAFAPNLYVYDTQARRTVFVANLSASDSDDWRSFDGGRPIAATPDGRFLLFSSAADLTPDASGSETHLYRYDAQTADLIRVSIGDAGFAANGNAAGHFELADYEASSKAYAHPFDVSITDDGSQVFFTSPEALTPGALNDVCPVELEVSGECQAGPGGTTPIRQFARNVYEYESGHIYLLSDGSDRHAVLGLGAVSFLGATPSGSDVFFGTADPLLPSDTDTQRDFYDAHAKGGFPLPIEPVPCQGDTCQPQGTPPTEPSPATPSFHGPGNEKPKSKKHHKKHHAKKHHKRAASHKRGGHK